MATTGLLLSMVCTGAQATSVVENDPSTPLLIDVRTPQEFAQGHLRGAINIENANLAKDIAHYAPDKNRPIELYCRSGRRATQAEAILRRAGYTHVQNKGGYDALKAAMNE